MKVVNDTAQRAIALMQQYNSSLTKKESSSCVSYVCLKEGTANNN